MTKVAPGRRETVARVSRPTRGLRVKQAPDTERAWRQFRSALAVTLSDLDEDDYLVISHKSSGAFVQFAAEGAHGMRAEAVSNTYLSKQRRLTRAASARLLELGWNAPTYVPDTGTEPPDGSPNYYLDAAAPVPYSKLAALAVESLRGVYAVRHPGELRYKAWGEGPTQIRFPSLKIEREALEKPRAESEGAPPEPEVHPKAGASDETVLEIAADGGSLKIVRRRATGGRWQFMALRNEEAMADLLSDEDREGLTFSEQSAPTESFATALAWLGTYSWERLYPLTVHPDYAQDVLTEVRRRGGREAVSRWQSALTRH